MSEIAPCKGCTDRHVGCHGECIKYKVFQSWIKRKHAYEQEQSIRCTESAGSLVFDPRYEKKRGKRGR